MHPESLPPSNGFLNDQLIPYIGSKRKLLPLLRRAIEHTGLAGGTFFDPFAGSGAVSRLAKSMGFRVVANDWEPYTRPLGEAYISCNRPPAFAGLGGIDHAFEILNSLPPLEGYITDHYCPLDDDHPDPARQRMFFTRHNGRRIDAIRSRLQEWLESGTITTLEFSVLLAPLIYQASYTSNTSGVFKGWHHGWGGKTATALYRIRSELTLRPPAFFDNRLENQTLCDDAHLLAPRVEADVAYLDPPYNQHQYGSNYHLLNTVALWDMPPLDPFYGRSGRKDKAAIRTDWRSSRRSPYCSRSTAAKAFAEILAKLRAPWILISYSTDGLVPMETLLAMLAPLGKLDVVTSRYKRYRVSAQRPSPRSHTTEFVFILDRSGKGTAEAVESMRKAVCS